MADKSKILVIGGTGYIGKFIVEDSVKSGLPTFVFVRESTLSDPSKSSVVDGFKNSGVTFITGDFERSRESSEGDKAGRCCNLDRRFATDLRSKKSHILMFGNDVDRTHAVEPAKTTFQTKAQIRRSVEAEGIPHTYVSNEKHDIGTYTTAMWEWL